MDWQQMESLLRAMRTIDCQVREGAQFRRSIVRKFLVAATVLALAAAPAFAGGPQKGGQAATLTAAGSTAGVMSTQGTNANAIVAGNGAVIVGGVSGNYTTVTTTGHAATGNNGTNTKASATQTNIGGTLAGGYSQIAKGRSNEATGTAGGSQSSGDIGGSFAIGGGLKATAGTEPR
jgi:hypothetical protein